MHFGPPLRCAGTGSVEPKQPYNQSLAPLSLLIALLGLEIKPMIIDKLFPLMAQISLITSAMHFLFSNPIRMLSLFCLYTLIAEKNVQVIHNQAHDM